MIIDMIIDCSLTCRPVGPGYDKGHSARLREQVDPRYRCGFFKWSNDARREMTKSNSNPR